jgi:hypothetical protein
MNKWTMTVMIGLGLFLAAPAARADRAGCLALCTSMEAQQQGQNDENRQQCDLGASDTLTACNQNAYMMGSEDPDAIDGMLALCQGNYDNWLEICTAAWQFEDSQISDAYTSCSASCPQ